MAAAEIKLTPLVTVIEQLRADNNESALMHDERDVKRDTMLVDINVELTSIKDAILSTKDVITESLQSLVFPIESLKSEITAPIVQSITESLQSLTFPAESLKSEIAAPIVEPAPEQEVTPPTSPQLDEVKDEMKTSNTSLGILHKDNTGLMGGIIEWLQALGNKIDLSNNNLHSINELSGRQFDLMVQAFGLQEWETRAADERAKEAARAGPVDSGAGAAPDAEGKKKGGLLKKMFNGI